jgi:hypothetical protein
MPRTTAFALLAVLTLTGCATDVANRYYAKQRYPAKNTNAVIVLKAAPDRPYEVIADLQCRGSVHYIQKQSAKIGADAVIVTYLGGDYSDSTEWADQKQDGSYYHVIGTAIRYTQTP